MESRIKSHISLLRKHSAPQCKEKACNIVSMTIKNVREINNTLYSMGINPAGKDPLGCCFKIIVVKARETDKRPDDKSKKPHVKPFVSPNDPKAVTIAEINNLKQTFDVETGYRENKCLGRMSKVY